MGRVDARDEYLENFRCDEAKYFLVNIPYEAGRKKKIGTNEGPNEGIIRVSSRSTKDLKRIGGRGGNKKFLLGGLVPGFWG